MPSKFTMLAKRIVPGFHTRLRIRMVAGWPMDVLDRLRGKRDPLVPSRGLWFIGGIKDPAPTYEAALQYLKEAGLSPQDRVLDMGCGVGFMAGHLARFVTTGSCDGFDVIKIAIDWASSHITKRYSNFRFKHADVFSRHYNPKGRIQPHEFSFPYETASFDFAFGLSLFTHLVPLAAERYLCEMARTMKPGATAWISVFLVNDDSAASLKAGKCQFPMVPHSGFWVMDPAFPETAVGLLEPDFQRWCDSAGLEIKRIDRGGWCGREDFVGNQDHVILRRG